MSTLRWGLIGASTIADEWMIPAIRETGGEVVTVHSRTPERAADLAARHDLQRTAGELTALLEASDIDAVFISTTNDRHHSEVLAAAAAGKHILCEKPIAMSVGEAREMVDAAGAAGVTLAVNHQQREQSAVRTLRRLISDGTLGQLRALRLQHAGRLREDLRTWRLHDPAAGAGVELDLTVHNADLVRYLLRREATEVVAMARREDGAGADTTAMAVLGMEDGLLVSLHEGFNVPFSQPAIEVHGDAATAICIGHTAQAASGELWLTRDPGRTPALVDVGPLTAPYVGVVRAFTDAVGNGGEPSASGEDGLRSLQIALGVNEAARLGRRVELEPQAGR